MATTQAPARPALAEDAHCDVCVIGAGFTGLTAALAFAREGREVVVLEAGTVGGGVSGHTTGKLSALHGLVYDELTQRHGEDTARRYADAQQQALAFTRETAAGIDCELREHTAYVFAHDESGRPDIESEVAAAQRAGLPATLVERAPLPHATGPAVALDGQLELHPRKYTLGLAAELERLGVRIHEHTVATGLTEHGGPAVHVDDLRVHAGEVVVASHMPVFDRGLWFTRLSAKRSYLIALRGADPLPAGMFISAGGPTRSLRTSRDLLLVGGEGHTVGKDGDRTPERYEQLERYAAEHFGGTVVHRWSSQDLMPADGLPYVGRLTPLSRHVHVIAGFRKWGLTTGPALALALAERLAGRPSPAADAFDAWRVTPRQSAGSVTTEGLKTTQHLVGTRLLPLRHRDPEDLEPGEGAILRQGVHAIAAHRDRDGTLRVVSPTCTHLGCRVAFNAAEQSWDCPCHASRFAPDGTVLQGPATAPLERLDDGED